MLCECGMARGWHGINIRFGVNTLNTFDVPTKPGIVLGEDDIYFIDIGPIWRDCEGDGGDSFTTGCDPEMKRIADDARAIFDAVQAQWQGNGLTGEALYRCAVAESETRGWQLNLEMSGHRLSEFPHAAHYKNALADAPFTSSPGLWMLEIQIRHPMRPFGAFFEDLLLDAANA